MNKSIKYLALAALAVSSNISAHTEHTYLARRSHNVNLPMELTTFYERTQLKLENRFGGNLQASVFYGETNGDHGAYFGINDKSTYTLARGAVAGVVTTKDFDLGYILHHYDNAVVDGDSTDVSYDPHQESWGVRFDYYQNMDKILKGLYLKVNMTVVDVDNNMDLNVSGAQKANLESFFKGEYADANAASHNQQVKLEKGLMTGGSHSETGVADIDVILGYKFLYKEKYHFGINLGITIPTGNDPDGVHMFEPVYGNHSHFGFGGGLDAHANLWTKDEQNIKLNFMANYRYLFEASENRPLKLKNYASPYVLLGTNGQHALTPAVNILTPLSVDVTPGSQFDGILALAYNNGGFSFDLGYNLYFREDDDTHVKGDLAANTYGVAARDFDTAKAGTFGAVAGDFDGGVTKWVSKDDVDAKAAETPSQCTNGIYGGLGYHFKKWEYPLLLGLGGKYDWASKNSEFDSWSIWGKIALSF